MHCDPVGAKATGSGVEFAALVAIVSRWCAVLGTLRVFDKGCFGKLRLGVREKVDARCDLVSCVTVFGRWGDNFKLKTW